MQREPDPPPAGDFPMIFNRGLEALTTGFIRSPALADSNWEPIHTRCGRPIKSHRVAAAPQAALLEGAGDYAEEGPPGEGAPPPQWALIADSDCFCGYISEGSGISPIDWGTSSSHQTSVGV